MIAGFSNAVNLTDGLDGLAIMPSVLVVAALGAFAYLAGNHVFSEYLGIPSIPGAGELAIFCGALAGAGLGFLWFNAYPAQVFMGDVGALAIGAALGTLAVIVRQEIVLLVMGGMFVLETASVMLQVASFKLTGQAHLPHGADPPSLRTQGLARVARHRALLDHQRRARADRPRNVEGQMMFDSAQARRIDETAGRYDVGLIVSAGALATFGVIMVASSSIATADTQHLGPFYFVIRHMIFLGLGVALAIFMARTELEWFERNAFLLLLLAIGLLLLVFVPGLGVRINGARRWIRLGILGFQSVEAVKLLFIVYLASYLVRHQEACSRSCSASSSRSASRSCSSCCCSLQPDFGSSALIIAVTVGMVWLGGARMRNLVYLAVPLHARDRLGRR